jgi:hypothetical protein
LIPGVIPTAREEIFDWQGQRIAEEANLHELPDRMRDPIAVIWHSFNVFRELALRNRQFDLPPIAPVSFHLQPVFDHVAIFGFRHIQGRELKGV